MSPADQIAQFWRGLDPDVAEAVTWDSAARGPFEDLDTLIKFAVATDQQKRTLQSGSQKNKACQGPTGSSTTAENPKRFIPNRQTGWK